MRTNEKALIITMFLVNIAICALWYSVPLIVSNIFSDNYALASLLLAIVPFVEILGSIPLGFYVTRGGARTWAIAGTVLLLFTPASFVLFSGLSLLSTIFLGAGSIATELAFGAYAFNIIKAEKMRSLGMIFSSAEIGSLIGFFMGGYFMQYYTTNLMLTLDAILLLIAVIIFVKYVEPIKLKKVKHNKMITILDEEWTLARRFKHFVASISIFSFMAGFFDWAIWIIIPLIIAIDSGNLFYGGIIYGLVNLPTAFGNFVTSRVYKRKSKRRLIIGSIVLSMLLMLLMPSLLNVSVYILVLLALVTFAIAITYIATSGFILERDRKDVAEFYTFETVSYDLGGVLGTILAGTTVALTGITTIAIVFAIMGTGFLAYFIFISRDVR